MTYPKEMRAYRKRAEVCGVKKDLREEALKHEAVVLFGPNVDAAQAVILLRRLVNQISNRGFYTGEDKYGHSQFERKVIQI